MSRVIDLYVLKELQLSHGFSAVDTEPDAGERDGPAHASIEPRLFSRGYPAALALRSRFSPALQ